VTELLKALLPRDYGVDAVSVAPARRGFVAQTFDARLADGRRVFVKWLPAWADELRASAMRDGLAVAEGLARLGLAVTSPWRTLGGDLCTKLDGRIVAVFDFIEGQPGQVLDQRMGPVAFNFEFEALVALLAQVHLATETLDIALPPETFALDFAPAFERAFAAAFAASTSAERAALQAQLAPHRRQIELDWVDLRSMAEACRRGNWRPVLTHGDLSGDNLMLGVDGRLYALDWDYPLLAPVERDAWFFTCDPEAEAAFLEAYGRACPGYAVDPLLRRFYLFSRFFEDIYGYIDIVLGADPPERKAWGLSELQKTCFEWLWPPMRSL
jgi:aminoglycoside phosphotransferase (APT) family kinase protein